MVGPLEGFADGWAKAFLCEAYQMTGDLASSLSSLMFIGMGAGSFFLAYLLEKYPDKHYEAIIACSFAMIASFILLLYKLEVYILHYLHFLLSALHLVIR